MEILFEAGADATLCAPGAAAVPAAGGAKKKPQSGAAADSADVDRLLLAAGGRRNPMAGLLAAASGGFVRVLERLIAIGVDVNRAEAEDGHTALIVATVAGDLNVSYFWPCHFTFLALPLLAFLALLFDLQAIAED